MLCVSAPGEDLQPQSESGQLALIDEGCGEVGWSRWNSWKGLHLVSPATWFCVARCPLLSELPSYPPSTCHGKARALRHSLSSLFSVCCWPCPWAVAPNHPVPAGPLPASSGLSPQAGGLLLSKACQASVSFLRCSRNSQLQPECPTAGTHLPSPL